MSTKCEQCGLAHAVVMNGPPYCTKNREQVIRPKSRKDTLEEIHTIIFGHYIQASGKHDDSRSHADEMYHLGQCHALDKINAKIVKLLEAE